MPERTRHAIRSRARHLDPVRAGAARHGRSWAGPWFSRPGATRRGTFALLGTFLLASAAAAQEPPAPGRFRPTLALHFDSMPRWSSGLAGQPAAPARPLDDPGFAPNAGLVGGLHAWTGPAGAMGRPGWSSLPHEAEAYPNGDAIRALGISPFSLQDGVLLLTASAMTPHAAATLPAEVGRRFLSAALNTYPFGQTYGYFEVAARVPEGRGLWPAFWLLPVDGSWPPEIDVPELLGHDTRTALFSLHTTDHAWLAAEPGSYGDAATTDKVRADQPLSDGFHRYGVDWEPDAIAFYLDGRQVARRSTPADMHKPFYLILNLAVGDQGSWPGPPDAATSFPATLAVRSIRAWQRMAP